MRKLILAFFLLLLSPTLAEIIELIEVPRERGSDLLIKNESFGHVTVRLEVTLTNVVSDVPLPTTIVVAPRAIKEVAKLRAKTDEAWSYRYHFDYLLGSFRAKPDLDFVYRLPFDGPKKVSQGAHGTFSHQGELRNSIDFAMPIGTVVKASRAGIVIETKSHFTVGADDKSLLQKANRVLIEHSDGTIADYQHLQPNGTLVVPGQRVNAGEPIGLSGNTGYTSGPHLHTSVFRPRADGKTRTAFPIRYCTQNGVGIVLEGHVYHVP